MIYILIFLLFSFIEIIRKNGNPSKDLSAKVFIIIMMAMTGFRYGVGTDYFTYAWYYNNNPINLIDTITYTSHMDIGYRILMSIFKSTGIPFEIFAGIIGVIILVTFNKLVRNNSKMILLSLLMFYGSYYHIYVHSAIRQGIALIIFFLAFYRYYKKGHSLKYITCIIIGALFHKSILITLIIPLIPLKVLKLLNNKFVVIGMIFICIVLGLIGIDGLLVKIISITGISLNYGRDSINILAILLRIINISIILFLFYQRRSSISDWERKQIAIYIIGMSIYFLICRIPMLSRLIEYFGILEIIIVPNLVYISKIEFNKFCYKFAILFLMGIILFKDLAAAVNEGSYYNKNALTYPYTSIFNKDEIFTYRYVLPIYLK